MTDLAAAAGPRAAPRVARAYAEWFAGPHPGDRAEAERLVELACVPERAREAERAVAEQVRSFGLGLKWTVAVEPHWSRGWEYPWILRHGEFRWTDAVLDVGGAGSLLPYRIAQRARRVDVLDADLSETERLAGDRTHQRYGRNVNFHQGDGAALPFADGAYDRVVCCSVLEHTADPPRVLRELWRVLRPGGRLLVTLDVADRPGPHCAVGTEGAAALAAYLGVPEGGVGGHHDAVRAVYGDDRTLRVLGLWADKAG